ncbi:MAG: cupin domain-containing protein [Lacunisphaera sp.]
MKPFITTLPPSPSTIQSKTILSKEGFTCSLVTLAASDKTPLRESEHVEEHILYVVEGQVTVRFDDVNTVIDQDHALLIPQGKAYCIATDAKGPAKLLRVEVPPRPVLSPEIITLSS